MIGHPSSVACVCAFTARAYIREISLWKCRYGEDEVIAYLDLDDVNGAHLILILLRVVSMTDANTFWFHIAEMGTLINMECGGLGFYFKTAAGHNIQFRVSTRKELEAWIFATKHNNPYVFQLLELP